MQVRVRSRVRAADDPSDEAVEAEHLVLDRQDLDVGEARLPRVRRSLGAGPHRVRVLGAKLSPMSNAHELPVELSSFVGRAAELDAVAALLDRHRLVTMVGPGGSGKTRLARNTAAALAERWHDGAWWVDLGGDAAQDHVERRLVGALDPLIPMGPRSFAATVAALTDRELLLVLDNCEHVRDGVVGVAETLLGACSGVTVLATSQVRLGAVGERTWRVPPMAPADAVDLLLARAAVQGEVDMATARLICERLDRLPLALELAAGWAGTLTLDEIAYSLADPLTVLHGGPRSAPRRQRSLAASIARSHGLLDTTQQAVFRRLGVFHGTFSAEAVAAVCSHDEVAIGDVLFVLRALVDSSLVVADTTGDQARFSMLGVITSYAQARLDESGETTAVRHRHLSTYVAIMESLAPLLDVDKDAWRVLAEREYPNLQAAIDWGLGLEDTSPARRLAAATTELWHLHDRNEIGLATLRRAVATGGTEHSDVQAKVLLGLAIVADPTAASAEGYAAAVRAEEMALPLQDWQTVLEARSLRAIGLLGHDLDAARTLAADVAEEAQRRGLGFAADASDVLVGLVCLMREEYADAIARLEGATASLLDRGDRGVAATGLSFLALALARSGRVARAAEVARSAVVAAEPLHDVHRVGTALSTLAEVQRLQGLLDDAEHTLERIDRLIGGAGSAYVPGWERIAAQVALFRGDPAGAVRWCRREGEVLGVDRDGLLIPDTQVVLVAALRAAGQVTEAEALLQEVEEGARALGLPGNLAAVLELRAEVAHEGEALAWHHEALRIRAEHQLVPGCVDSLEALSLLSDAGTAGVLAGAADAARGSSGYAGRSVVADRRVAVTALLADADLTEQVTRGRELSLTEAVAYAARARGPRGQATVRLGEPHPDRGVSRRARRGGPVQPGHREAVVHGPRHREDAPCPRLRQARRRQPHRTGPRRSTRPWSVYVDRNSASSDAGIGHLADVSTLPDSEAGGGRKHQRATESEEQEHDREEHPDHRRHQHGRRNAHPRPGARQARPLHRHLEHGGQPGRIRRHDDHRADHVRVAARRLLPQAARDPRLQRAQHRQHRDRRVRRGDRHLPLDRLLQHVTHAPAVHLADRR